MKIDVSKIENYANLSVEEKLAALEGFEYEDNAEALTKATAEIDRYKNAISKANSEAKQWKDKHNALLSDEEKAKQANDEALQAMQTELAELRQGKQISEFAAQYIALGYDKDLAMETATAQATGDFQKMMQNHTAFLANQRKVIEAEALKQQPGLTPGKAPDKPTLEEAELMNIMSAAGL